MIRRNISRFRKLNFLLDIALTLAALACASMIENLVHGKELLAPIHDLIGYRYALFSALVLSITIYLRGDRYSYRLKSLREFAGEAATIVFTSSILFAAGVYLLRLPALPRLQFGVFVSLQFTFLLCLRLSLLKTLHFFRSRGYNRQQTLIVGSRTRVREVVDYMLQQKQWGLNVVGIISLDPIDLSQTLFSFRDVPVIGSINELPDIIKSKHIDHVFFTVPGNRLDDIRDAMLLCEEMGVVAYLQADLIELTASRYTTTEFAGKPTLVYSREPELTASITLKALLDRVSAVIGLVVLSPILAVISMLVKASSKGPILFIQERCGLHGRRFNVLKFRTMVADAEALKKSLEHLNEMDGAAFKIKNDPRITPLGRFLRKLSLDELPQLINVARGDMSLVGPRPPLPDEVQSYDLWQRRKLSMKPGLTCLWQIGDRNESTFDQWMRQDLEYIDNWSLMLDAKILIRTIPAIINATGR